MRRRDRDQKNFHKDLMELMHAQADSLNLVVGALNSLRGTVESLVTDKGIEVPAKKDFTVGDKVVATLKDMPFPLYGTLTKIADTGPEPLNPERRYLVTLKDPFQTFDQLWFDPKDLRHK